MQLSRISVFSSLKIPRRKREIEKICVREKERKGECVYAFVIEREGRKRVCVSLRERERDSVCMLMRLGLCSRE